MMTFDSVLDRFGRWLAQHLRREVPGEEPFVPSDPEALRRTLRLGDVARVWRGYADPPVTTMRFGGRQAIGLAVSMKANGDVIELAGTQMQFIQI